MIGWWVAEREPETIRMLLPWPRESRATASAWSAVADTLPGSSITLPLSLAGGGCNCTRPGTLTGASGSFASRRSFHTA